MQNYAQIGDITHYYITYLSFQLLRNHLILQHINYSFLYLTVPAKPELSMHGPIYGTSKYLICFLTNIYEDQIDLQNNNLQWKINFCQELC